MKSDVIEIDVELAGQTARAVRVHTGDKNKAVWLPLSQIEIARKGYGWDYRVILPEWLALEKGLI